MGFFVACLSWDFDFWVRIKLDSLICIEIKLGRFVANKFVYTSVKKNKYLKQIQERISVWSDYS